MRKILILLAGLVLFCVRIPCRQAVFVVGNRAEPSAPGSLPALARDYPIRPKTFIEVKLEDAFWKPKVELNAETTIPHILERTKNPNALQAALYSLRTRPDPAVRTRLEAAVRDILAAQGGRERPDNGFFELAADLYALTGRRELLDQAIRSADIIDRVWREEDPPFSGGERDAVNAVQLYRATGDPKHLDLARHYLDIRGLENSTLRSRHNQSHRPVLEQDEAVGHAVNAATLMLSLADVGVLAGRPEYLAAAKRLWRDVVGTKLYITGGIGSTGNEGFGRPYELPNISSYCETCASIMFATFNHRMFLATGEAKYIDVMERAMYNAAVAGVSVSGDRFFYVNRLASAGAGRDVRWEWASLPCCPPNLVRFLASMSGYIYAQDRDRIYVNLYVSSTAAFRVDGKDLILSVKSEMPWGGRSEVRISSRKPVRAAIKLRIPGWARNVPVPGDLYAYSGGPEGRTRIAVNGSDVADVLDPSGYVSLDRTWRNGDVIRVELPFDVHMVVAHPKARVDRGRVAVERGPIVFCVEGPECEGGHALGLLWNVSAGFQPSADKGPFGAVPLLSGEAKDISRPSSRPRRVKLIPYHLWANRGAAEMSVWLSAEEYAVGDTGPAGGRIFYINPNWAADGWRYLEGAPADQSAGAPWGCFRTRIPGAAGTAVGTGRQNTADARAACPDPGTAAGLCAAYGINGFSDWFLPSIDELTRMYLNLKASGADDFGTCGAPDNHCYWSSTQVSADMAFHLDFADNGLRRHFDDKDYPRRVRAIRAF